MEHILLSEVLKQNFSTKHFFELYTVTAIFHGYFLEDKKLELSYVPTLGKFLK